MAVSLVLNQWFLLTLDIDIICENRRKGILFLCGGFDVCADKTCQNKHPFWQILAQQHAVVGELAARDLLELPATGRNGERLLSSPATS